MKKTAKKTKTKKKTGSSIVKKAKTFLAGKKATQKWATVQKKKGTEKTSPNLADSLYINKDSDPAHSPGHRKMNLKEKFGEKKGSKTHPQNGSSLNNMTRAARVKRTSATN